MHDIKNILFVCLFAAVVASAILYSIWNLKRHLIPLLSLIDGRFRVGFLFAGVIEGFWQNRNVKILLRYGKNNYTELLVQLSCSRSLPASFKVRPTPGFVGMATVLSVADIFSSNKFEIPDAGLTVWTTPTEEPPVRQFLNSTRLSVIKDLFCGPFNRLESHMDPITGGCLKLRVIHGFTSKTRAACHAALEPGVMSRTLEKLREFETAEATNPVSTSCPAAV